MKVLISCFHNVLIKGDEFYYKNSHGTFLNELSENIQVGLICGMQPDDTSEKEIKEAGCKLSKKVSVHTTPALYRGFYQNPLGGIIKFRLMAKTIRNYDVVHIFVPGFFPLFAVPLCLLYRKKISIYIAAGWSDHITNFHNGGNILRQFALSLLSRTSEWLCDSFANYIFYTNKNDLNKSRAKSGKKHLTFPLVLPEKPTGSRINPTENKTKNNLIFIGEVEKRKNLEILFESMNILKGEGLEFSLTIVGDSDNETYKASLRERAAELKLMDKIEWKGWIGNFSEVQQQISSHFCLVLPSSAEGFPKVIYEAQIQGLPVIVSDLPNYRGMLVHRENALIFNTADFSSLAEAIKMLKSESALYADISSSGREFAEGRLRKSAAAQYQKLLQDS